MQWRDLTGRGYLEAAVHLSTLSLALMPVMGMQPMVWAIVLWILLLTLRALRKRRPVSREVWRWTLLLASPFLLMLLDLMRAPDLAAGWHIVERSAALVVFPVGFLLLGAPAAERTRHALMDILSFAILVLTLGTNTVIALHASGSFSGQTAPFAHGYREAFAAISGMHPPYAAYFLLAGALFQTHRALDAERMPRWRLLFAVVLFACAALIASRVPLMAFIAASILLLSHHRPRRTVFKLAPVMAGLLLAVLFLVPLDRERIGQLFTTQLEVPAPGEQNSVNERVAIAQCTLDRLEDNWLLGMGQAKVQPALDACYGSLGLPFMQNGSYGTHCQLLHWWLSFGLAGLAAFVVMIACSWLFATRHKDPVHLAFLAFLVLCSMTEDLLARQWGVVLFACFNTLFITAHLRPAEER